VSQPSVLVIAETPGYSQAVSELWQLDSNLPPLTAVSRDLCQNLSSDAFDLAIIESSTAEQVQSLLSELEPHGKTTLVLVQDPAVARQIAAAAPRAVVLTNCSIPTLLVLATEILKRIEAGNRLRSADEALAAGESSALLGRYITEMRHSINNALTSVMGNSELLLFEAGAFSAHHRMQIETIRTMSVRIHEIMQRLGSLETEMKWVERQKVSDQRKLASAAS
jgi:signal transduction histidine kinase